MSSDALVRTESVVLVDEISPTHVAEVETSTVPVDGADTPKEDTPAEESVSVHQEKKKRQRKSRDVEIPLPKRRKTTVPIEVFYPARYIHNVTNEIEPHVPTCQEVVAVLRMFEDGMISTIGMSKTKMSEYEWGSMSVATAVGIAGMTTTLRDAAAVGNLATAVRHARAVYGAGAWMPGVSGVFVSMLPTEEKVRLQEKIRLLMFENRWTDIAGALFVGNTVGAMFYMMETGCTSF